MIRYFCDKCGKELDSFNGTISSDTFKVTIEPPEIRRWLMTQKQALIFCAMTASGGLISG